MNITEEEFESIELSAGKAMREWERGYYCQDINIRHHTSWWVAQETAKRVSAAKDDEIKQLVDHLRAVVLWKDVIYIAAPDLGGFLSVLYRAEALLTQIDSLSQALTPSKEKVETAP